MCWTWSPATSLCTLMYAACISWQNTLPATVLWTLWHQKVCPAGAAGVDRTSNLASARLFSSERNLFMSFRKAQIAAYHVVTG